VEHVRSVEVAGGREIRRELRCDACAKEAKDSNSLFIALLIIAIIIAVLVMLAVSTKSSRSPLYRHGGTVPVPALQIEV